MPCGDCPDTAGPSVEEVRAALAQRPAGPLPSSPERRLVEHLMGGAAGLAKAGLQSLGVPVDEASDETAIARREKCRDCDRATRNPERADRPSKGLTTFSRCLACDCYIVAKTKIASERCPLGKW